jgi:HlyD family secretion protein
MESVIIADSRRLRILGLVVLGALPLGCADSEAHAPEVHESELIREDEAAPAVAAAGTLKPVGEVEVGSQVSGRIVEIPVDFNDVVREGDVLARLDPQVFQAQLRQAEAALQDAESTALMREAALRKAELDLPTARLGLTIVRERKASAEAQQARASRSLDRVSRLEKLEVASEEALDRVETEHTASEALLRERKAEEGVQLRTIQAAEAAVQMAHAELAQARAIVAQRQGAVEEAKVALSRTVIRSPIDGLVIDRKVATGQTVAASLEAPTLFKIARSLKKMEIHARLDEADIGQIRIGQRAKFNVAAYGERKFDARVAQVRVAPEAVENVVTYTVVLLAENADASLLPGMTAVVEIGLEDLPTDVGSAGAPRAAQEAEAGPAGSHGGPPAPTAPGSVPPT